MKNRYVDVRYDRRHEHLRDREKVYRDNHPVPVEEWEYESPAWWQWVGNVAFLAMLLVGSVMLSILFFAAIGR